MAAPFSTSFRRRSLPARAAPFDRTGEYEQEVRDAVQPGEQRVSRDTARIDARDHAALGPSRDRARVIQCGRDRVFARYDEAALDRRLLLQRLERGIQLRD